MGMTWKDIDKAEDIEEEGDAGEDEDERLGGETTGDGDGGEFWSIWNRCHLQLCCNYKMRNTIAIANGGEEKKQKRSWLAEKRENTGEKRK
jgi:hypothetical protein